MTKTHGIHFKTTKKMLDDAKKVAALKGYKSLSEYMCDLISSDINSMDTILGNTNIIKSEVNQLTRMVYRQTSINNRLMFYILEYILKDKYSEKVDLKNWLSNILDLAAMDIVVEEDILGWGNIEKARSMYEKNPQYFMKENRDNFIYNSEANTKNEEEKEIEDYEDIEEDFF